MSIRIGNAPCSWGVEFPNDPRNPDWKTVLKECAEAGYKGIELGPVGFMPEDPAQVSDAFAENGLEMIGGVVFRAFHDATQWDDVLDGSKRTCEALVAHGARHLVLIDSISPRRAPTAGRALEAEHMDEAEWAAYVTRFREICKMGVDHGLTVGVHAHAAGFMDFEPSWSVCWVKSPKICYRFVLIPDIIPMPGLIQLLSWKNGLIASAICTSKILTLR